MTRLALAVALVCLVATATAQGAVGVAALRDSDVALDRGVSRPDTDRQRLEKAAADLRAKGFPTKFAILARRVADPDREAGRLRRGLGESAVSAVLVLGPRQLGIDAKVFDCERRLAFDAEVATLRTDEIQGTINVARRLEQFNEAQVLRDENCKDIGGPTTGGDGISGWLIGALVAVALGGVVAFVLARRAAKRAQARRAAD